MGTCITILFVLVIGLIFVVLYIHDELLIMKDTIKMLEERTEKLERKDINRVTSRILDTINTDDELHG